MHLSNFLMVFQTGFVCLTSWDSGLFTTYKTGLLVTGGGETIVSGGMRVKVVGTTIADGNACDRRWGNC